MDIEKAFRFNWRCKLNHRNRFKEVFRVIGGVHSFPDVPQIEIYTSKTEKYDGAYHRDDRSKEPKAIEISKRGETHELTLVHEIGHFLEMAAIPRDRPVQRQWAFDSTMARWRLIASTSSYAVQLTEILSEFQLTANCRDSNPETAKIASRKADYVSYLRSDEELWARSYAQYVSVRSGNATLLEQVELGRSPRNPFPLQWDPGDFEPIAVEIDGLLRQIGWRP